jgi:hypothetical protein
MSSFLQGFWNSFRTSLPNFRFISLFPNLITVVAVLAYYYYYYYYSSSHWKGDYLILQVCQTVCTFAFIRADFREISYSGYLLNSSKHSGSG